MISVLIVEDSEALASELVDAFTQWGFEAHACTQVAEFWGCIDTIKPTVIVVGLMLQDGSGADIIRQVRAKSDIGVIVISTRNDEVERVACIEMGADDYLVKPFSARELVARIRQLMYRTGEERWGQDRAVTVTERGRLSFGGYVLDVHAMLLTDPAGDEVSLTTLEFAMLRTLVTHARQVLSREFLLSHAHAPGWVGSDRNVDNLISRIRKKVVADDGRPLVRTVRGAGYMFTLEANAA